MARYLVTGGCGFIGSHLADALVADGHQVVILDDLSTGKRENAPKQAEVIIGDAVDYNVVERAFKNIDGCFHLAAVASVERSNEAWVETHKVNVTATVNIFQAASRQKSPVPVVYTSSAAIYGDNPNVPLAEDSVARPLTAYGADKYGCELHARVAWLVHRVPNIGIRPFNIYGPRQDPKSPYSGVISIFADRISNHMPYTINGDGKQTRDFVFVLDIVKVYRAVMEKLTESCEVLNVCTGRATSVNELADTLEKICGYQGERRYGPPRKGDARASVGNPAKLRSHVGFVPSTTLEQGLRMIIEHLKKAA